MTDGLRVLIADDERPAREKLRRFLEESSSVAVIYEARDGVQAIDVVRSESPDLVFLDIGMPGLDGLSVAESMGGDPGPYVVFVTAYDEHAIRAFELGAADYLLKPYDRERFLSALSRVQASLAGQDARDHVQTLRDTLRLMETQPQPVNRLIVESSTGQTRLLSLTEVVRFDAHRNYVRVTTRNGAFRMRQTMSTLERRIPMDRFARINRSQIVNLDCIRELTPAGHGDVDICMTDGATVRLSRRYRDRVIPAT